MPRHPSAARPSRHRSSLVVRTGAALVAAATLAALPTTASAAPKAKTCSKAGKTIAIDGKKKDPISRVWRKNGKVYACTTLAGLKPRTRYVTKGSIQQPVLNYDTFAWTTTTTSGGSAVQRVSAFDLPNDVKFLNQVKAIPRRAAGDVRADATVDALRVDSGNFVAWVAGGSTVVLGAKSPDPIALQGDGDAETPLYLDGDVAVAGQYEGGAATTKDLVDSLKVAGVPGDHGDSDDCAYSYLEAFTWKVGAQAFEAQTGGTRGTPYLCP